MGYNTIDDVVSFVESYYEKNGNKKLIGEKELAKFVRELQQEISRMKFSVSEGTTVIM